MMYPSIFRNFQVFACAATGECTRNQPANQKNKMAEPGGQIKLIIIDV